MVFIFVRLLLLVTSRVLLSLSYSVPKTKTGLPAAIIKMFIERNAALIYLQYLFSYLIPIKRRFQFDKYSDSCQFAFGNQCCFKYNENVNIKL